MSPHVLDRGAPYLHGELSPEEHREVADHLRECAECADALARMRAADAAMRAARHDVPDRPPLAGRVGAGVALERVRRAALRRRLAAAGGLAAVLVMAFAWTLRTVSPDREPPGQTFVLLFQGGIPDPAADTPAARAARLGQFMNWYDGLRRSGRVLPGARLEDSTGRTVSPDGRVLPLDSIPPPLRALTGFVAIRARDYAEAEAIARTCPVLEWGGNVVVRRAR